MKYLLPLLLLSINSFAQISEPTKTGTKVSIGKVAPMGTFIAELSYSVDPGNASDTAYLFEFNNYKYQTIREKQLVVFSATDNTKEKLYGIFKSVFADENKDNKDYAVSFKLGTNDVSIGHYRSVGTLMAAFIVRDAVVYLTSKQVDKIFGK